MIVRGFIENQRPESAKPGRLIVKILGAGSFQAEVRAISREASVPGKTVAVISKTDLGIGGVVAAVTEHQLALSIALKSGARDHVENSVGTVAVFGVVAATLDFQIVNVFRVELGANVGSDAGVGHGHAVQQPGNLVAAADVQLIVNYVGAGRVVRDHSQAVALIGARRMVDSFAAYHVGAGRRLRIHRRGDVLYFNRFGGVRDFECKMRLGLAPRREDQSLLVRREAWGFDGDAIFAERNVFKPEFAGAVTDRGARPVGSRRAQRDLRILHGTVLRIVNESVYRAKNRGAGSERDKKQARAE